MAPSAQEMDEARKKNTAYEYLCHLEEAKIWMEAVLGEKLPPAAQLEEALQNGVYLARLAHVVSPDEVPLTRIYDKEQRRYKVAGLQFRHTDNINYWIKSLRATELPRTFHPETTDVYDRKNMPRVVYCIHALSTHLFKLGLAPAIEDLYGKVQFSDADISRVQQDLDEIGVPIPAFQKIGTLLSASTGTPDDQGALNDALIEIDDALENQNRPALIRALLLPGAKLHHIDSTLSDSYQKALHRARANKRQDALNRSLNDSFEASDCSEVLDVAEIQGRVNNVNGRHAVKKILRAVESCKLSGTGYEKVAELLSTSILQLKGVRDESAPEYIAELSTWNGMKKDLDMAVLRQHLQGIVDRGNRASKPRVLASRALDELYSALDAGDIDAFACCLRNPALRLDTSLLDPLAFPLYFSELRMDRAETGMAMSLAELTSSIQMLGEIAKVSRAVDSGDVERTWKILNNPLVPLVGLDTMLKVQYFQTLAALRETTPVLSFADLQSAVDQVNSQSDQQSKLIGGLQAINEAVSASDTNGLMRELRNPALGFGGAFVDSGMILEADASLLLSLLQERRSERAKMDGAELWLDDVQTAAQQACVEVHEARTACYALARLNLCLSAGLVDSELQECVDSLASAGLLAPIHENGQRPDEKTLRHMKEGLMEAWRAKKTRHLCSSPWISHKTRGGFNVYLNMDTYAHSWNEPINFSSQSQHLDQSDVARVVQTCNRPLRAPSKRDYENRNQRFIRFQARCRGFLIRQRIEERRAFWFAHTADVVRIQSWWRGVLVRRAVRSKLRQLASRRRKEQQRQRHKGKRDVLDYYRKHEHIVVLAQALWRGRRARKAFLSLVHQPNPPFKVIRLFAPLLEFSTDDYERELALQSLRGKVVQTIRHNQQLSQHLNAMDIKIGLLVQHRISLQDVVAHGKTLNSIARNHRGNQGPHTPGANRTQCTLKMLTREGRRLLDGYRHLFYALQTNPHYLAKLLIQLPQSRIVKSVQNVILSLFNFGANQREEYLLLKLFQSALEEEIRCKCQKLSDAVTTNPLVIKMVVNYARQHSGQNALRTMIGPLIEKILNDKHISIETNPVDIYKAWRNQMEMDTGKISDLPLTVSADEALSYREVRCRLNSGLEMLQTATLLFLERICESRSLIPYGLLYIARTLQRTLLEVFPGTLEKDVLKIVGNLVYYQFINSAIVAPDAFDTVTLPADRSLSSEQRRNLASIAKILQFAASKKGFGEESRHLVCLNPFIVECHERFKEFFRLCCEVEDLDEHFSMDPYSEAKLRTEPQVYMTLQEITDTHNLLLQYEDQIAPDAMDPLHELLEDLGGAPTPGQLLGGDHDTPVHLLQMEVCLSLQNKFSAAEEDTSDLGKLLVKTKELLVVLLPFLQGDDLLEALTVPDTPTQQFLYEARLKRRDREYSQLVALNPLCDPQSCWSLRDCKQLLRRYLSQLELAGLASGADSYQSVVTSIAQDFCHKVQYRQQRAVELVSLRNTLASLDEKSKALQEQVDFYDQYVQRCLENLSAGKRKVHAPRTDGRVPRKMRCKMTLKYSASRLQEKGVLLEVEDLPCAQLKNVTFEIAPTSTSGMFSIKGKFMGVEMEKIEIDIQHLLELQFEGVGIMDMFGKAKVNVNLLLFLLNQKFYGK